MGSKTPHYTFIKTSLKSKLEPCVKTRIDTAITEDKYSTANPRRKKHYVTEIDHILLFIFVVLDNLIFTLVERLRISQMSVKSWRMRTRIPKSHILLRYEKTIKKVESP